MEEYDPRKLEDEISGLHHFDEKTDESQEDEFVQLTPIVPSSSPMDMGSTSDLNRNPSKRRLPEKEEFSDLDETFRVIIGLSQNGKKVTVQRPGTGQLLQVDLGQLEQFLEFYGRPVDSSPLRNGKISKIIENLINGHTVEQVTDQEVAYLVESVERIETVPKRGKGTGRFKCKICPHLFPESSGHGLSNKESLTRHYKFHLKHHIGEWKCSLCEHKHFRIDNVTHHIKRIHGGNENGHPIKVGDSRIKKEPLL
ncbi:Oidioi.mRNA.OKI2018_I69.chr2.g6849.t1.cds [Oikopleura dioica]|uniref:Oidioi.mRNA.OKI2018_I69.chr2.g6849.t1.cds n=1 Tax=Oikopleura dioica TaxID=34765 RepID=A0ABN7T938_OIKDI|nr:Oidioi.mRNA.OKI2018_I69.chr2.g6849.t1.cds [Oikopleura dioica]